MPFRQGRCRAGGELRFFARHLYLQSLLCQYVLQIAHLLAKFSYRGVGGSAFNRLQVVFPVVEYGAINPQSFANAETFSQCFIRSSAINWNALGYLLTRFFTPTRRLFSRLGVVIANVSF